MMQDTFASLRTRLPDGFQNATYQWVCSKRGRITLISGVLMLAIVGLLSQTSSETLTAYRSLSSFASSSEPSIPVETFSANSALLTPSQVTVDLEAGSLTEVPKYLKKGNPSFHVLVPSPKKNDHYCKSTLSGMILNYPPPTLILGPEEGSEQEKEAAKIKETYDHIVKSGMRDDDLVLVMDGNVVWFQLPSDVMIRQYEIAIQAANARLKRDYGVDSNGEPVYNQTTIWAAQKVCNPALAMEPACQAIPNSPLPAAIYGPKTDTDVEGLLHRAKYLSSKAAIGPAKDIRDIYGRALEFMNEYRGTHKDDANKKKVYTAQMALSSVFGQQEFARRVSSGSETTTSWHDWLSEKLGHDDHDHVDTNTASALNLEEGKRYNFAMGLDYTFTLFQTVAPAAPNEFIVRKHDNPNKAARIPRALSLAQPPYSNFSAVNALSPNKDHLPYITELRIDAKLDVLPDSELTFANLPLIANAILPSLPVALIVPDTDRSNTKDIRAPTINWWKSMWYQPIARALLRRYFRSSSQGVLSFHNAAVGGDRNWDNRGGSGGVWTNQGTWLEWGVETCNGAEDKVFDDGKGEWLKETRVEDKIKVDTSKDEHIRKRDMYGEAAKVAGIWV